MSEKIVKAVAVVGFYRGEQLVRPGEEIDLPVREYLDLFSCNQVAPREAA